MASRRPGPINTPVEEQVSGDSGRVRLEIVAVTLIVIYLVFQGARGLLRQYQMNERYRSLVRQIAEEEELKAQQKQKLERLQDPRYIEFLARDRLGLVKRGEKVYKLAEPERGVEK